MKALFFLAVFALLCAPSDQYSYGGYSCNGCENIAHCVTDVRNGVRSCKV